MNVDRDMWVKPADRLFGARDLGTPDILGAVDHLPLQVREGDEIVIHDADRADAGRREILDQRRSEPARPDHQHRGRVELCLPGSADLPEHEMAGVAFDLLRT
jgi:hypothetical protein